jgi:SAM-dependent methyltransferase
LPDTQPAYKRTVQRLFGLGGRDRSHAGVLGAQPVFPPYDGRSWFQAAGEAVNARGEFVGCPLELFELTARDAFCVALMQGMRRDSSVLEIGCGCLRVGYWFVKYLDEGRYCGVEPNRSMLDAGRELILGDLDRSKRPRFDCGDRFDFRTFATGFDMVVAYSIWTHASKPQISSMLDGFLAVANPGARLIASWIEPRPGMADYLGAEWVGRSHKSNVPGSVAHRPDWIKEAAESRGLKVEFLDDFTTIGQGWLAVSLPS